MAPPTKPSPVINDFIANYYSVEPKRALARSVHDLCHEQLRGTGIKHNLHYRPKTKPSLKKKLEERNVTKNYKGPQDIFKDIPDFAGVRIALYFPKDRDMVEKMIKDTFDRVEIIEHWPVDFRGPDHDHLCLSEPRSNEVSPHSTTELSYPTFEGYVARHARVYLKEVHKNRFDLQDWKKDDVVEIQIVSILMHAWAQVEHDILYKSEFEDASQEEVTWIRTTRGLIGATEVIINQLHKQYLARTQKPFEKKSSLSTYLEDRIKPSLMREGDTKTRYLGLLLTFLRQTRKNDPKSLNDVLHELNLISKPQDDSNGYQHWRRVLDEYQKGDFQPHDAGRIPFCIMAHVLSKRENTSGLGYDPIGK